MQMFREDGTRVCEARRGRGGGGGGSVHMQHAGWAGCYSICLADRVIAAPRDTQIEQVNFFRIVGSTPSETQMPYQMDMYTTVHGHSS